MIKIESSSEMIDQKAVTAYIQQQMVELQPHLHEKSALQVKLVQLKNGFEAQLTAIEEEGEIQTIGRHADLYDAIRNAKEGLLDYFVAAEDELNPRLREEKLNYMSKHGNLYLH